MEKVTISNFKATCLELLKKVQKTGQPILVTRLGEPIAQVMPPQVLRSRREWFGSAVGTGKILGDIVSPLGSESWEVVTGRKKGR
ncbi:type II toxin-antitoxin system Phd/YefM family antitoxin [bacterium]|nr:type II toxin-antitoxin system Phd/YefM family antitoxin [bacterium]